jgi:prohibitin 1
MNLNKISNGLIGLGSLAIGLGVLSKFIYRVEPGERAIIFDKLGGQGMKKDVKTSGFHFFIPFKQEIIKYDIRINVFDHVYTTGTMDLQKVMLKIRFFFRPIEKFIPKIHLDLNKDYMNKILPAIGNEVAKAVIARYDAEHLLKNREKISKEIKDELVSRAKVFMIILDDVSIFELQFSPEFMASIEKKQVAQQEAERYKYVVLQKEQEKLAKIIEAEGNSIAAKMISDSVKKYGSALIELRKIQAAKEIVEKISESNNIGFIPFNANMLLNLNQ